MNCIYSQLVRRLHQAYHDEALSSAHAWWLLEAVSKKTRAALLTQKIVLTDDQIAWLDNAVERIVIHQMPIQYVIGSVPFLGLTLQVAAPILIPRPETEAWVDQLIIEYQKLAYAPQRILDLCTGSGCIALAWAQAFPQAQIDAVDCDAQALMLLQKNIVMNKIANVSGFQGDLFEPLLPMQTYDLIVANPPYIPWDDYCTLDPSVRLWEAQHALTAGKDDMALIKRIIAGGPHWLADGGRLAIEIDATQGLRTHDIFKEHQFLDIRVVRDYHHHDRMVTGIYRKK